MIHVKFKAGNIKKKNKSCTSKIRSQWQEKLLKKTELNFREKKEKETTQNNPELIL